LITYIIFNNDVLKEKNVDIPYLHI